MPMTTVFRNARVFDGHRYLGPVESVVVADGRVVSLGESGVSAGANVVDSPVGCSRQGSSTRTSTRSKAGLSTFAATCRRRQSSASSTSTRWLITRQPTPTSTGSSVAAGHWLLSQAGSRLQQNWTRRCPGRPVFLPNRDHHGAWVSSRALELAGIGSTTPDPPDGRIERDASSNPTGMLQEGAMKLITDHLPATSDELYRAFIEGQRYLHSLGVTGWQDAIVGEYAGMDDCGPTYARAARSGDLTGWVVGALWWDRTRGLDQLTDLLERRAGLSFGRFAATTVKIMQDGVAENGTAAMLAPYLDRCGHATDNTGHSFVDPERLKEYVAALDHEGFQVHVHGLGDRSVRETLDAFVGTDPAYRHHIAHLQLVDPADIPRFAALGVTGTIQALWACLDDQMVELTLPFLSEERARHQYPFADLVRAGAPLAAGSDWPVSTPDPLAAIHVAVHRTAYGESGPPGTEPFLPEQRLDLTTAFTAYTSGSARVNHRDDAGSLAPGKLADLVVPRPRPVRRRDGDRCCAGRVDVGRWRTGLRSVTARVAGTWLAAKMSEAHGRTPSCESSPSCSAQP